MSGIYTGAMGMISYQTKIDTVGNNIANSKTNGFKRDQETFKVFNETFMRILSENKNQRIGAYQNQVHVDEIYTNFEQGALNVTERMFDFAIQDATQEYKNFFRVETNGEQFLTRDGSFQIDNERFLTMNDGSYVLDSFGDRIQIPENAVIGLNRNGDLMDANTEEIFASLGIVSVSEENKNFLEKIGNNKFKVMEIEDLIRNLGPLENLLENYDNNATLQRIFRNRETIETIVNTGEINVLEEIENYALLHGALETSNVDLGNEMVELLSAQKGYQASAKVLQTMDKILEKDANQIGI